MFVKKTSINAFPSYISENIFVLGIGYKQYAWHVFGQWVSGSDVRRSRRPLPGLDKQPQS